MARLVMKFGGTSVADIDRIRNVARHVKREVDAGHEVAVVVSAMAGETNKLVAWTNDAARAGAGDNQPALPDQREYDVVVAAGEQVTCGLLAITLNAMGIEARSWLGWQVPINTNATHGSARIEGVPADAMRKAIEAGEVAVVAGFQGVADGSRISTLGRGGSDTSAVAVAAGIGAARCASCATSTACLSWSTTTWRCAANWAPTACTWAAPTRRWPKCALRSAPTN